MAYKFQAVDLSFFDFHMVLDPLLNPASINSDFGFLVDPVAYQKQYQSGLAMWNTDIKVSPLKWRTLTYHHFWKYYQTIWSDGGVYDFWKLQMPFIGKPMAAVPLTFDSGSPAVQGVARVTVFLTAMGWSTNVDLHLRGDMTPEWLSKLVGQIFKASGGNFKLDGTRQSLAGVFEHVGNLVRSAIYSAKIIDSLRIKRHTIITLSSFTGPITNYFATQSSRKQMPPADRALFHSILKGAPMDYSDVIKLENPRKFLLTQYSNGPDFAITYFDHGTLLFMQQSALFTGDVDRLRRSKMRCHSSNIRNYLLTTLDLYSFCRDSKKSAELNPKVKSLREAALYTLHDIPNKYTNQFCESFHQNFGPTSSNKLV